VEARRINKTGVAMNNRDRLIDMMVDHKLERREISELLKVDRSLVDNWLLPHEAARSEEIPDMAIELLEYKLKLK
jgi:hypothetical protein